MRTLFAASAPLRLAAVTALVTSLLLGCSGLIPLDLDLDPGSGPSSDDGDSDGVRGADDNCPTALNPLQEDGDADGRGDACDACPHDRINDGDSDGACGDVDNCLNMSNADQADTDGDGIGDRCDGPASGHALVRVLVGPDARSGWVRIGFRPYVDITVADVAWLVDPGPAASVTVDDIPTETFVLVRFTLVAPPASAGPRPLADLRFFYPGGGIPLHGDFAATCELVDGAGAPGGSCGLEPPVIGP